MSRRHRAPHPSTTAAELRRFEAEQAQDLTAERRLLWSEVLIVALIAFVVIVGQAVAA